MSRTYTGKIQKKRESLLPKIVYIIKPFVVYLLLKTMAMIGVSMVMYSIPVLKLQTYIELHPDLLSAVINAIASILGVCFVIKDFLAEVDTSGEVDIDRKAGRQFLQCIKKGFYAQKGNVVSLTMVSLLSITTSIFFNGLIGDLSLKSAKYDNVEQIQYSVPIWLGLILYGLVSPVVEEIVFRGVTYHRMRRFYRIPASVIVSSLLFGGFHANLPQFLYAVAMGSIMALCFEWNGSFFAPVLFHMIANIFVFVFSQMPGRILVISSWQSIVMFGMLSILIFVLFRRNAIKNR